MSYSEQLRDTILKNQAGDRRRTEFGQLKLGFDHARWKRISRPYDEKLRNKIHLIEAKYDRLHKEIRLSTISKKAAVWTEEYFLDRLNMLNSWSSLTCQMYIDLGEAGADTTHALECCMEFRETLCDVIERENMAICIMARLGII